MISSCTWHFTPNAIADANVIGGAAVHIYYFMFMYTMQGHAII